jgi:hypothetical protein
MQRICCSQVSLLIATWRLQSPSTVFSQITAALYLSEFRRCADLFPTQRPTRGLSPYDQFLALVFGQLTYRESLRDVVCCLRAKRSLLYHLGFRGNVSRTNLAYLMVAIVKKRLNSVKTLNEILQIVSVSIFEQTSLQELLATGIQMSEQRFKPNPSQKLLLFNC